MLVLLLWRGVRQAHPALWWAAPRGAIDRFAYPDQPAEVPLLW